MNLLFWDLVSGFKWLSSGPWSLVWLSLLLPFSLVTGPNSADTLGTRSTPGPQPWASRCPVKGSQSPCKCGRGRTGAAVSKANLCQDMRQGSETNEGHLRDASAEWNGAAFIFPARGRRFLLLDGIVNGIFFYCGKVHKLNFTVSTIFKCTPSSLGHSIRPPAPGSLCSFCF